MKENGVITDIQPLLPLPLLLLPRLAPVLPPSSPLLLQLASLLPTVPSSASYNRPRPNVWIAALRLKLSSQLATAKLRVTCVGEQVWGMCCHLGAEPTG